MFLREKPAKILLGMKGSKNDSAYVTILSKRADCTYSHTIKILNAFKKMGIVEFKKSGRIKKVSLTSDGAELANGLDSILRKFNQIEEVVVKKGDSERRGKK